MARSINLTGTAGKNYDLEALSTTDTRSSQDEALVVQVWYWNPNGIDSYKNDVNKYEEHKKPNPPDVQIGQIWLSKLVPSSFVEV